MITDVKLLVGLILTIGGLSLPIVIFFISSLYEQLRDFERSIQYEIADFKVKLDYYHLKIKRSQ